MNVAYRLFVFLILLLLGEVATVWATESDPATPGAAAISIEANRGLVTLNVHDAPLHEVLSELGKLAGFKIILVAAVADLPRVNASFENLPAREIVERLVVDTNRIIFFDIETGEERPGVISQVWLLGPGAGYGYEQEERLVLDADLLQADGKLRSEAVLRLSLPSRGDSAQGRDREAVAARLAQILLRDHDPLVRVRAAIALGALREEHSIPELEIALLDQHASVRTQVINALGQIGGDRATMILGSILLDENLQTMDRVLAAQALWKQDSESAAGYLGAGAEDSDEQVRMASSRAPSMPATGFTNPQPGPQETE